MIRYFSVEWSDLGDEARERIEDSVVESLRDEAEEEGQAFLRREWNDPKPRTWQEAYVRIYCISHIMWDEYERGEQDADVPSDADWASWLEDSLRDKAQECAYRAFKHLEVEIDLI